MLFIVILGLIAKLALVSCECDLGPAALNNFDLYRLADSRPWYWLLHTPQEALDNLACDISTLSDPDGDSSAVITVVYYKSLNSRVELTGNATNVHNTGLFELQYTDPTWNGGYNVLAIDYDRYLITKYCADILDELIIAVAFRRSKPDKSTMRKVREVLRHNGIDISQLAVWTTRQCQ